VYRHLLHVAYNVLGGLHCGVVHNVLLAELFSTEHFLTAEAQSEDI
jgi:hypothetical protein